jgi:hypothetical protein
MELLSINADAKTVKGIKYGYLTAIQYLSPAKESGVNLCTFASNGCKAACLYTAGRGATDIIKRARLARTKLFLSNKYAYFSKLILEIQKLERRAKRENLIPCVRLNGTSDIPFEKIKFYDKTIFQWFPHVQFYDYTKNPNRTNIPINYHLTFSRSETNEETALQKLKSGSNVAVVFRNKLPKKWNGFNVTNGDLSDLRFLDKINSVVGLIEKGKAKQDESNFVVDTTN